MELFTREKSPRRLVGMALEWDGRIWISGFRVTLFNLYIRLGYSGMPHSGKPGSFEFQEEVFRTPTSSSDLLRKLESDAVPPPPC